MSVDTAGDVDGDGYTDVIVGAPWPVYIIEGYPPNSTYKTFKGNAFIYYGSSTGLDSRSDWKLEGNDGDRFGLSVGAAGDINGDGYADVIIGAPHSHVFLNGYFGPARQNVVTGEILTEVDDRLGEAFVYYGSPQGLNPAIPDWVLTGDQDPSAFGFSVSSAGDVNGDGFDDIIVGAPFPDNKSGKVFIYYGFGEATIYRLTLEKGGSGLGTVIVGDEECGPQCSQLTLPCPDRSAVILKAIPSPGSRFVGWTDADGNSINPPDRIHHATDDVTLIAVFELITW
jgi:hypothetical protein